MNLAEHLSPILRLCQKHGLPSGHLEEACRQYEAFQMPVPVLGSYNAGKSSLLNTLLGTRLLPTGLVAKTGIPTEITYGEANIVTAFHSGHSLRLGLGELRSRSADFTGVRLLRAECDNLFLRQIDRLRLVDMPGLDGLDQGRERALRDYLPQSLAYILVFSADEPVIKESVSNFLHELKLRDIPVVPVLTKADKIPPDELARARAFLERSLRELFLRDDLTLCTVSARGDVEAVRQRLLLLQEEAGGMIEQALGAKLREAASGLRAYLSLRMEIAELAGSEADHREASLQSRMDAVHGLLEERTRQFSAQAEACREQILRRLGENVRDAAAPIETMLYAGNNPWEYADGMLCATVTAGLVDSFDPMVKNFVKQLASLLKIHGFSQAAPFDWELASQGDGSTLSGRAGTPSRLSVEIALQAFESTQDLFGDIQSQRIWGARRQERIAQEMAGRVIPEMHRRGEHCLEEALRQSALRIKEAVASLLSRETQMAQKALADIRREQTRREDDSAGRIEDDLTVVQAALDACPPSIQGG